MISRKAGPLPVLSLLLALGLSCGDDGGGPAEPEAPAKVTTEPANAASKTIGLSGGTISTTASDGTKYTLVVPVGAIAKPTRITVTPVRDIDGFPVLDDVAAGLQLSPSGLVFAIPLALTIESPVAPGPDEFPIAVNFEGDADAFTVGFATVSAGKIVVPVQHFSGFGLDFGTVEDMSALFAGLSLTPDAAVCANELLLLVSTAPDDGAGQEDIMRRWFEDTILPGIDAATTDGELLSTLSDFYWWRESVPQALDLFLDVETSLAAEIDQAREALVPKLRAAVTGNNDVCAQAHSLDALRNVIFWQKQAEFLEVDTPANGLDAATVRASLCAELVIEGASLPDVMQAGFPHSLDFRMLLKFSDGTTQDVACAVSISATNATIDNPTGFTDPFGNYTTVITATANDAVSVIITGNVIMPGETVPSLIEQTFFVNTASGSDLNGSYMGTLLLAGSVLDPIVHTATITQNQNAVSATFEGANFSGSFTATLSGTELIGIDISVNGSSLEVVNAAVQTGTSTSLSLTLSGTATINGSPVTIEGMSLSGPNCRWENLSVAGSLNGATIKVERPGGAVEVLSITGTASLTATAFSATFSGGGFSGTLAGPVTRPGQGTNCTFIGIDGGSLEICDQSRTGDFCIGTSLGRFVALGGGVTCPSGDDIIEVRISFGSGAGLAAFCQ